MIVSRDYRLKLFNKIPLIWDTWLPKAEAEFQKQITKWEAEEAKRLRRVTSGKPKKTDNKPADKPERQMLPGDEDNFLKFAAALKIIMARSIDDADIPCARTLLYDYLAGFLKVRPYIPSAHSNIVSSVTPQ